MDVNQYRNFLLSNINGAHIGSGGKEVICRCFNTSCEDCYDYRSKGHFYIKMPEPGEPSLFNCFKCGYNGVVTHERLLEWNIFDQSLAEDLIKYNNTIRANKAVNDKYFNRKVYRVYNTLIRDDSITPIKLDYINGRLGTNLTYNDIRQLKIILNLYDLINENSVKQLTRNEFIVDQLDKNFIGFLSSDNAFINMRRLCDEGLVHKSIDKRYINYKLYDKFDTSERFYIIPTVIRDIYSPKTIKINISEGPFDILSVYLNLRNKEEGIYISGSGCNYFGIVLYCLEVYGIINAEIHFYADTDTTGTKKLNQAISSLKYIHLPVYVHKNMYDNEKDFGVPLSRIKESVMKVL